MIMQAVFKCTAEASSVVDTWLCIQAAAKYSVDVLSLKVQVHANAGGGQVPALMRCYHWTETHDYAGCAQVPVDVKMKHIIV